MHRGWASLLRGFLPLATTRRTLSWCSWRSKQALQRAVLDHFRCSASAFHPSWMRSSPVYSPICNRLVRIFPIVCHDGRGYRCLLRSTFVSEPQATSARWRALTHRAIRMLYPGLEEYAITELVATMLRWSATIFSLAGSSPAAESSPPLIPSSQLRRIADAVYKLARVTREEILSTTFEVVLVESGDAFDEGKMTNKMRDYEEYLADDNHGANGYVNSKTNGHTNGNGRGKPNGAEGRTVLCTTELGLRCVTRRSSKAAPEENGESELFENRLLLLPKVVLNSAVEAIERGQ